MSIQEQLAAYKVFNDPGTGSPQLAKSAASFKSHDQLHNVQMDELTVPIHLQRKLSRVLQKERRRQAQTLRNNLITPASTRMKAPVDGSLGMEPAAVGVAEFLAQQGATQRQSMAPELNETTSFLNTSFGTTVSGTAKSTAAGVPQHFLSKDLKEASPRLCRANHSLVRYENAMYVFGGRSLQTSGTLGNYLTGVCVYIPNRAQWVEVPARGPQPLRRGDHSGLLWNEKMVVFGGRKGLHFYDDMSAFDFTTGKWEKIDFEVRCGPGPIFGHSAAIHRDRMFVIGGVHKEPTDHLCHAFDLKGRYWVKIDGPGDVNPNGLYNATTAVSPTSNELVVLGLVMGGANVDSEAALIRRKLNEVAQMTDAPEGGSEMKKRSPSKKSRAMSLFGGYRRGTSTSIASGMDSDWGDLDAVGLLGSEFFDNTSSSFSGAAPTSNQQHPSNVLVVHVMDLTTHVWTAVRTVPSPDSPIAFTTGLLKDFLLPHVSVTTGCVEENKDRWHFPVLAPAGVETGATPPSAEPSVPDKTQRHSTGNNSADSRDRTPPVSPKKKDGSAFPSPDDEDGGGESGGKLRYQLCVLTFMLVERRWMLAPVAASPIAPGDEAPTMHKYTVKEVTPFERRYCAVMAGSTAKTTSIVVYGGGHPEHRVFARLYPADKPSALSNQLNLAISSSMSFMRHRASMSPQAAWLRMVNSFQDRHKRRQRSTSISSAESDSSTPGTGYTLPPALDRSGSATATTTKGKRKSRHRSVESVGSLPENEPSPRAPEQLADANPFQVPLSSQYGTPSTAIVAPGCPVALIHPKKTQAWHGRYYRQAVKWVKDERKHVEKRLTNLTSNGPGGTRGKGRAKKVKHFVPSVAKSSAKSSRSTAQRTSNGDDDTEPLVKQPQPPPNTREAAKQERERTLANVHMGRLIFDAPMLQFDRRALDADPELLVKLRWALVRQYVLSGRATADAAKQQRRASLANDTRGSGALKTTATPMLTAPMLAGSAPELVYHPTVAVQRAISPSGDQDAPARGKAARHAQAKKGWSSLLNAMTAGSGSRRHRAVPVHPVPYEMSSTPSYIRALAERDAASPASPSSPSVSSPNRLKAGLNAVANRPVPKPPRTGRSTKGRPKGKSVRFD